MKECNYCQCKTTIHVHGHEQCTNCKTNIEPCCQGSQICEPLNRTESSKEGGPTQ